MNKEDLDKKLAKWEAKAKTLINWIAVNKNGEVWGFVRKPNASKIKPKWFGFVCVVYLGTTEDEDLRKNWNKTLRKVNYE